MRKKTLTLALGLCVVVGCKSAHSSHSPSEPPLERANPATPTMGETVATEAQPAPALPTPPMATTPGADRAPVVSPVPTPPPPSPPPSPSVPTPALNPASTLSGNTNWFGSEMRTKKGFGSMGHPLRVTWRVKPARGNCVITLLSLFNGDRIFSTNTGSWSEITYEIFGGAPVTPPDFQTQYITRGKPSDSATTRGKGHAVKHQKGTNFPNIFDNSFHNFQIEWKPGQNDSAYLSFRLDGKEIRREAGGDLSKLEDNLDVYTSVWVSKWPGEASSWGCSDKDHQRPDATAAVMDSFVIEQWNGSSWQTLEKRLFDKAEDIWSGFDHSNWGFESFAGKYCPANAVWQNNSEVRLDLNHSCRSQ